MVEFYRMSGDVDYLLRVVVPDIAAYDVVYKRLITKIDIRDVSSAFAMEQIKVHDRIAAGLHEHREGTGLTSRPAVPDYFSRRASRDDVSQRLPPIIWTSL